MKRLLLNISICALTFGLGTSTAYLWRLSTASHALPHSDETLAMTLELDSCGRNEQAQLRVIDGLSACGPNGSYHAYQFTDGGRGSVQCKRFSSAAAARRALRRQLPGGAKIIERYDNFGEAGVVDGETIIIDSDTFVRLSTHGPVFCKTTATALEHLRLL